MHQTTYFRSLNREERFMLLLGTTTFAASAVGGLIAVFLDGELSVQHYAGVVVGFVVANFASTLALLRKLRERIDRLERASFENIEAELRPTQRNRFMVAPGKGDD